MYARLYLLKHTKPGLNQFDVPALPALQFEGGPVIFRESGIAWHVVQGQSLSPGYIDMISQRCSPGDLVLLSMAEVKAVEFTDNRLLYNSLESLRILGEWRHLGLLRDFDLALQPGESWDKDNYDFWVALSQEIRQTLQLTGLNLRNRKDTLVCPRHFRRFTTYTAYGIDHAACPVCNQLHDGIPVERVVAVLDQRKGWVFEDGRRYPLCEPCATQRHV